MKLHKRILNQNWAQTVITFLLAAYLRLVRLTGRWEIRGWETVQKLHDGKTPALICFWHGRLIANIFMWPKGYTLYQLSTRHRDGQLAGKTYARFGITPVWLNSQSPTEATRKLVKLLKDGGVCSITPDGPKGPRQRMPASSLDIARLGGAVLVPVASSGSRMKVLNTWDRMQIPLPFACGALAIGEPVEVPRRADEAELETLRRTFEDTLNAMTRELDAEFGQPTPAPAPEAVDAPAASEATP